MELEEILQKEKRNEEYIFLYQEDGNWYAYEHSAFYCYSLLGIFDVDWLTCTSRVVEKRVIRICVNNLDRLLYASSLQLIRKQSTECVLMCKILCGGFHFWRGIIEMKYQGLQKERI
ncbi:hypothetical protein [Butyricimonas faecalis]|jgi:putative uncharacterized protein aapH|uniref:Uncharacterized protein n=1 Tax=Butyricimonas faecalis TaxID=2093856 RepID=A0A3S9VQC6_9BACT|nr:hypothetical protein [Butyricimonas faecalis]AZS28720.1 hypothetical protein D8S85_03555 [Butyricimonas faecalis]MBS7154802.1 hypothetical protein [Sanguibacteroides justesenii]